MEITEIWHGRPPEAAARALSYSIHMGKISVLLIEDEENIASFVSMYLEKEGHEVRIAATGEEGLSLAEADAPDVVILDIMLPGIDGFEVCRSLRRNSEVPIIMLTARDTSTDKVVGLELGADDYVTKPFDPRELVARVKSVMRRSYSANGEGAPLPGGKSGAQKRAAGKMTVGDITVDADRHEVTLSGNEVKLAAKEYDLLRYLLLNRGLALSRQQLLEHVWGYDFYGDTRTVDVHINQLRKKLGTGIEIETVRSIGYKLK